MTALTPEMKAGYAATEAMKLAILELGQIPLIELIEAVRSCAFDLEMREASGVGRGVQAAPDFENIFKSLKLDRAADFLEVCQTRPADAAKRLYAVAGRR